MKINEKTSNTKNLVTKMVSMVVNLLATMIITSLVVEKLGNVANGYNQMANDFVSYVAILSIALNSMACRFITMSYYKKDNNEINIYYNSVLFGDLILAGIISVPLIVFTFKLNQVINIPSGLVYDVKILFALMFINFVLNLCFTPYSVATLVKNRVDLDSLRSLEGALIKTIAIIFLFEVFEPRVWYVSIGTLIGTVYYIFMNIHYTHKLIPEVTLFKKNYFKWDYIKILLTSGIWNSLTRVGAIFLNGLDLLIANLFISPLAMGVLSVSKTLPKYILTGMSGVSTVFTPGVMIEYAKNDKKAMVRVIDSSIKLNSLFSIIIEVGVIVFSARLYLLWMPGQDAFLLQKLTVVAMLGYIILMPFEVLWVVFTATNKVKISSIYLFIEAVITISIVIVSMFFVQNDIVKVFIVAGTSTVMETIRGFIFLPLVSAKLLDVSKSTFYKPLCKVILAFVLSLFVSIFINNITLSNNWFIFVAMATLSAIGSFIVSFVVLFNREERHSYIEILMRRVKNG